MKREAGCSPALTPTEETFDVFMAKTHQQQQPPPSNNIDHNHQHSNKPSESDKDSDYGGSDCGGCGEATTLRMLLERTTQSGDVEFAECCCEAGLLSPPPHHCSGCGSHLWSLVASSQENDDGCLDGAAWQCSTCLSIASLRSPSTWLVHLRQVRLKDAVLVVYCWTKNYPVLLCSHETELPHQTVRLIYQTCSSVASDYFNNEISNLKGCVEVTMVRVSDNDGGGSGMLLGGCDGSGSMFVKRLNDGWTRDDLISALVDNLASSASLIRVIHPELESCLGVDGFDYLLREWRIPRDTTSSSGFDHQLLEERILSLWRNYKSYHQRYSEDTLAEFLFRLRIDASRDPFLFFLAVISTVYPSPTI